MVSGAELRSEWSVLLAGSAFVTYRTNYLLRSHCVRVPCSQPQIGPVGPAPLYGFCVHTGCDPVCSVGSLWFHILTAWTSVVDSSFHSHSGMMLCLCHCSLYANGNGV